MGRFSGGEERGLVRRFERVGDLAGQTVGCERGECRQEDEEARQGMVKARKSGWRLGGR